ncbi:hypothetical protein D3C85_1819870 [compost metagenome]
MYLATLELERSYERLIHGVQTQPGHHGGDYDARQPERDAGLAGRPSLLEGLPHFMPGNGMPAYMTIDRNHLSKQ